MCNSCGDKLWRWSCLHVSIFLGPVVHESWPLQRTLGRCQLQGLSLTGMTKSLSFSHFPLIFPSFTVKCVYINCAWSHALKITLVKNFFKFWYFHTILYQYGLVISLAVFHDFLHSFTPGLFCYSLHPMSFTVSHLAHFLFCRPWGPVTVGQENARQGSSMQTSWRTYSDFQCQRTSVGHSLQSPFRYIFHFNINVIMFLKHNELYF